MVLSSAIPGLLGTSLSLCITLVFYNLKMIPKSAKSSSGLRMKLAKGIDGKLWSGLATNVDIIRVGTHINNNLELRREELYKHR